MARIALMNSEMICAKVRNGLDESVFYGHAVSIDEEYKIVSSLGNPHYVTFIRSSSKPIQAMAIVLSGAYEKFNLNLKHLAIASGSHNGQKVHTDVVGDLLYRCGVDLDKLLCGIHPPLTKAAKQEFDELSATPINHNCSGKHAGMLAVCMARGWNLDNYNSIEHPVQQMTLAIMAKMCGIEKEKIVIGVDGCGVPVFGMPLINMSIGFSNLSKPDKLEPTIRGAVELVAESVKRHPLLMGGEDRVMTAFLEDNPDVVAKDGAEAVFCCGKDGKAFTFKLECGDGADPFRFTMARLSSRIGGKVEKLKPFYDIPILSTHNQQVGQLEMRTDWKPW
ncbi:MAG: asparaginase [Caldiserica bacterium]|nr:asparaginase [Caldisericota bacterium]